MNDGGNIAVSPHSSNIVFATGNVYNAAYFIAVSHSTDGGATWGRDTIPLGTRGWTVAFDPLDSNRVYIGGDSAYSYPALLVTTDLGATWTQSRTGLSGAVNALAGVPGSSVVYAGTPSGGFKSPNAGASWAGTGFTIQTRTLAVDPNDPATIYAGTYGSGVHVTTDGGTTWTPMNTGLTNLKVLALAARGGLQSMLFAGTEGGAVFRTDISTGITGPASPGMTSPALGVTPNPARGCVRLQFTAGTAREVRASLYDHAGRVVADLGTRRPGSEWSFSTRGLTAGTYFVRVLAGEQAHIARLTVVE